MLMERLSRNDENGRMSINGQYYVCENIAISIMAY